MMGRSSSLWRGAAVRAALCLLLLHSLLAGSLNTVKRPAAFEPKTLAASSTWADPGRRGGRTALCSATHRPAAPALQAQGTLPAGKPSGRSRPCPDCPTLSCCGDVVMSAPQQIQPRRVRASEARPSGSPQLQTAIAVMVNRSRGPPSPIPKITSRT
jgi:hypothetical protein